MRLPTPLAILFDLDDTILACEGGDFLKLWQEAVDVHICHFNNLSSKELFLEIRSVADEYWSDPDRHRKGRLNIRATRQEIVCKAALNLKSSNDKAAIKLANYYHDRREYNVKPFDGALETLSFLQKKSIKMGLITNGSKDVQWEKINKFHLKQYFDVIIVEGEFGYGKPNEKVYHHALNKLKAPSDRTWIIGDNLDWEVKAPQKLGIFSIWNDYKKAGLPTDKNIQPDKIVNSIYEITSMLE